MAGTCAGVSKSTRRRRFKKYPEYKWGKPRLPLCFCSLLYSSIIPERYKLHDCAPGHSYGPTFRSYHLFHFVTKGCGTLEIDGRSFALSKGDAFLIPAEMMSYYEASGKDPWSYSWMGNVGIRAAENVRRILRAAPETYVLRGLDAEKYAASIKKAADLTGTCTRNYFLSEVVLYEVFAFLEEDLPVMEKTGHTPSLAVRVRSYLNAKYTENLQIRQAADHFHVHPNHLSRVFREAFGVTPKQYLLQCKTEKAKQLLAESDAPVSLISVSLGFEDQHAFSKLFRNYTGQSPVEYRKNNGVLKRTFQQTKNGSPAPFSWKRDLPSAS